MIEFKGKLMQTALNTMTHKAITVLKEFKHVQA